jgi:hypothetical protein
MTPLESTLDASMQRHQRMAEGNYRTAYCLSALAVIASIIAGLSVAADWFPRYVLAILSATPGAVLVVLDRLKLEERSDWHWRRVYALGGLLNQLRFEAKPEAEVSAAWSKLMIEMQPTWPRFGRGERQPD